MSEKSKREEYLEQREMLKAAEKNVDEVAEQFAPQAPLELAGLVRQWKKKKFVPLLINETFDAAVNLHPYIQWDITGMPLAEDLFTAIKEYYRIAFLVENLWHLADDRSLPRPPFPNA